MLQRRLTRQLAVFDGSGNDSGLLSITLTTADLDPRRLPPLTGHYLYWARPAEGRYRLGLGETLAVRSEGPGRFRDLAAALPGRDWCWIDPDHSGHRPAAFCAFAFDPGETPGDAWQGLPNSLLQIPSLLLQWQDGHGSLTFSARRSELARPQRLIEGWLDTLTPLLAPAATANPTAPLCELNRAASDSAWLQLVQQATADIRAGRLEKVVAARALRLRSRHPWQAPVLLGRLARLYPDCTLLAVHLGKQTLISATPERLLSLQGGVLRCDALGGTTGRDIDPHHDRLLALRLRNSKKARHEHALVVTAIRRSLEPLCETVDASGEPEVVRLRNLQHLWTGIRGRLRPGIGLLDAAARLHPTPAVAGTPTTAACDWLRRHEDLARGWYSGGAGWLEPGGDGELAVLLRCALLQGCDATLFAGAGIVADSEPLAELRETEMKLEAMLEVLHGEAGAARCLSAQGS
ncbi:isochorismate synthase [Thiohalobacter sp. IOR34]|uniref:isochorismate synthase n=1 Tax=Thiohalobacter sp. IOR34 TaxID=3057176 RepID=UPI0025B038A9|nr:isochorismate synthase [Thiohalobacter sp. IOR34]WJW75974.1 isochorismate synthase [Thiohalobacter sp. IOR34]